MPRLDYKEYRRARLIKAQTYLGGKCVICGHKENLEFDHIDPATKSFKVSVSLHGDEKFWEEVNKCQLLCRQHHAEKTSLENAQRAASKRKHGTRAMYDYEVRYGTPCDLCRAASAEYMREWRASK